MPLSGNYRANYSIKTVFCSIVFFYIVVYFYWVIIVIHFMVIIAGRG